MLFTEAITFVYANQIDLGVLHFFPWDKDFFLFIYMGTNKENGQRSQAYPKSAYLIVPTSAKSPQTACLEPLMSILGFHNFS